MGGSENTLGIINTRETPSAADAAVVLMETLIDGCTDRETIRKRFMEKFGGDKNAARVYFNLALRRLVNAGKVVVAKSGGSEVICRSGELAGVIERWGDLIDALTWRSERGEIDPDIKANGRIITYFVRRGMLKALAAFLCRGMKVWAYINDPIDLSLTLAALQYIVPMRNLVPPHRRNVTDCTTCPNGDVVLLVPRNVLLTYMATTMTIEDGNYVLKLPGEQTVRLRSIKTNCMGESLAPEILFYDGIIPDEEALYQDGVLSLIIYLVRVVD
jgi:hypothetical protein